MEQADAGSNPYTSPVPADIVPAGDQPPAPTPGCRPWGFWATVTWSLLCGLLFVIVQTVVGVLFLVAGIGGGDLEQLGSNGLLIGTATCAAAPICLGFLTLVVYLRGCPLSEYFGLQRVAASTLWKAVGILLLLIAIQDGLTYLLGRPIVPEFMEQAYRTAGFLPLLILAVVLAAPALEEVFFRGFMHRGLAASRIGPTGAILITAALWALLHLQYDWYGITTILLMGLFLGAVRTWTGSTALTILLHALNNLVATVETIIKVELAG
jgi:uncharacterized protein